MSSRKTEHLKLHLWKTHDEFHREEFNENSELVDAGVKAAETKAATALSEGLSAQTAALNAYKTANDAALAGVEAKIPQLYVGTYVGTGTKGADGTNTLTFPFVPKLVMVSENKGVPGSMRYNGQAFFIAGTTIVNSIAWGGGGTGNHIYPLYVTWSGKSLSWYTAVTDYQPVAGQLNENGQTYHVFAIG